MENTWASGALELLRHADSHIELETAFDKRIAFISIDNSVETSIRTFLSLPESKSGVNVTRRERDDAENSFPKLLALLFSKAAEKLTGLDDGDIEHYHRIRNTLYHDGTGLSVDTEYLRAYRSIAAILLQNLFGVSPAAKQTVSPSLDTLIRNWNQIEQLIQQRLKEKGVESRQPFLNLSDVQNAAIITHDQLTRLVALRSARNSLVHSVEIDRDELAKWATESDSLLGDINS